MDIKIDMSDDEFNKQLQKAHDTYRRGVKLTMFRALTILEAAIMSNIRRNFARRSGRLLNSIPNSKMVRDDGKDITGEIGPVGVPYARIHEYGGIIKPKKSKFLAIPLEPVLGPDGIAKASPLDFKGRSFFSDQGSDGLILFVMEGNNPEPYFLMKRQVKIPERAYLRPAMEKNRDKIAEKFGLFLQEHFTSGGESM